MAPAQEAFSSKPLAVSSAPAARSGAISLTPQAGIAYTAFLTAG